MANLIIKSSSNDLVIQGSDASPAITVGATGTTTFAENATMSGTLGVTGTATLADAVITKNDAFVAKFSSSGWTTYGGGVLLPFNDVSGNNFNNSSCFSTTSSKYTAPVGGSYMFWFTIYTGNSDVNNGFKFIKNDAALGMGADDFTFDEIGNQDRSHTGSLVLILATNDTIHMETSTPSDVHKSISMWGGCRIR